MLKFTLFIIFALSILAASNFYLIKRCIKIYNIRQKIWLILFFPIVTISFILSGGYFAKIDSTFARVFHTTASILGAVVLYLLVTLILFDIINLIKKIRTKIFQLGLPILTSLILTYGIINAYHLKIIELEIPIKNISQELTIVQISDLHLGEFRAEKFLQKVVDKINQLQPDIVVITGDIIDTKIKIPASLLAPLKNITSQVYFVEGNHDLYGYYTELQKHLIHNDVTILENRLIEYKDIQIIGLKYMKAGNNAPDLFAQNTATVYDVLQSLIISPDKPSVLLQHNPAGIEYAAEKGVSLVLSGHTHGGQMFPTNLLGKIMMPYFKGYYEYQDTKIYVSQGTGTFAPPVRIGTNCEITFIKLKPQHSK